MNWSTFVEDYNELTALSFDHLYHFGKEDDKLEYLLREDNFFNRKTLSNINIHKTIFLWIYFLMLINGFNHKFVRL